MDVVPSETLLEMTGDRLRATFIARFATQWNLTYKIFQERTEEGTYHFLVDDGFRAGAALEGD